MKVVCVHLFNDYSGSPLILSTVIKGFRAKGYEVDLLTSGGREGFLSNLDVTYRHFIYKFFPNKYARLVMFMLTQVMIIFKMLRYWRQDVVIYINTLLPFGAGIAGKIMRKRVVYHIHEVSINPPSLKKLLKNMADKTASETIFVSETLMASEKLPNVKGSVVYNGLSKSFIEKAGAIPTFETKQNEPTTILMLCSLKDYKGVKEFVKIAEKVSEYAFELVINSSQKDIDGYFKGQNLPSNLTVFPTQKNVHPFYRRAHLVLNLSRPDGWVETFGMTILEGMYYGVPAIVPQVGGPTELIMNDFNGYQMDSRDWEKVAKKIKMIFGSKDLYKALCENAKSKSNDFSSEKMIEGAISTL